MQVDLIKYIDNKLSVSSQLLKSAGINEKGIESARRKGTSGWYFHKIKGIHGLWVEWDPLKDEYKSLVEAYLGCDPYQYAANSRIKDYLKRDYNAIKFFENYKIDANRGLPREGYDYVSEYARASNWANLIIEFTEKGSKPKLKQLGITREQFWSILTSEFTPKKQQDGSTKLVRTKTGLLEHEKVALPYGESPLRRRINAYKLDGYKSLISGKFGNDNTRKIKTEEHKALLLKLISLPQNLSHENVAKLFNESATQLGWGIEITAATVKNYLDEHYVYLGGAKHGKNEFMHKIRAQVKRAKPSSAGMFFSFDGWTVELYFKREFYDEKGHKKTDYNARLELLCVFDPFNDYIVGYVIGKENVENSKAAMKAAVDNIYRLTGKYYLFNQLQTDNYSWKTLHPFYSAISKTFTPAEVNNSKAKPVEAFFDRLNDQLFRLEPNTSGHNLTARRENQPNTDWLDKHKQFIPTVEEGFMQITKLIEKHRSQREAMWLESFNKLVTQNQVVEISREQYLLLFGSTTGHTNRLTPAGINVTIGRQQRVYDLLDPAFRNLTHIDWKVVFDTNNLSDVLVMSPDGSYRFSLQEKYIQPMALMDRKEGDAQELAKIRRFNKEREEEVTGFLGEMNETTKRLAERMNDPRLKSMLSIEGQQKKHLQDAKGVVDLPADSDTPEAVDIEKFDIEYYKELARKNL